MSRPCHFPATVLLLLLAAPSSLVAQQAPGPGPRDSVQFREISLERFGLALWQRVSANAPKGNLLFSPASLSMALTLTFAGASGGTAEAFAKTLGIPQNRRETYDSVASNWLGYIKTQKSVEFSMANSLWASQSFPLLSDYRSRMKALYGAELERVNLTSPRSVELINSWVSRETRGKIPTLFEEPPLELDTGMVLLNALYFKGKWTFPFDTAGTRPRPFYLSDGRTVQRPSMMQFGQFGYLRGDRYRGLRLPYADGRFAMYVLLPDSGVKVGAIGALADSAAWVKSVAGYQPIEVDVALPKFTVRSDLDLKVTLRAAGLAPAFDSVRAEFYRMVPNDGLTRAWITKVLQNMMEVSEQGTEAAAATAVIMDATTMAPPKFVVDRPFAIALRDERSGSLLFIGRVEDPQ